MTEKGIPWAYSHKALRPCPFCNKEPKTDMVIVDNQVITRISCVDNHACIRYESEDKGTDFYVVTFAILKAEEKWNGWGKFDTSTL